ncbi:MULTISPECIES: hypothetical protein [Acinetobacter]|uniref:Uncharacterized protein n=1 Tax=Acinetobacter higginsii TaxID=70347 RepID=N8XN63_9GAMM|nr:MULTISPECIES: hypothetical protein [Acinetobacter]ENV10464.1 hypothetical protein F966_01643 [Acinetobacter higginsii]ENX56676.1 hypothetical protein F885_04059 [Acinetobacter higginsii]ENX60214.1 hypothetical protein F902_00754 [Acinetobacter higginsii]MCH7316807.1 hypothetical protein [Acinetobacter higginsii]
MTYARITKYYYHHYFSILFFFLTIGAAISVFWSDFSPSFTVEIVALIIACFLYALLLIYFLYLKKRQEWVIPRQWQKVRKQPKHYALFIFPLFIIPVLWLNLAGTLPMIWTYTLGKPQIIEISAQAVKKRSKNTDFYSFQTIYSGIPIFRITSKQYAMYRDHQLKLKLSTRHSTFGTYVMSIDEIQVATQNPTNK